MIGPVLPVLLALALAAEPLPGDEPPLLPVEEAEEPVERPPRLDLTVWGGEILSEGGSGASSEAFAAEATWRFDAIDVGVLGGSWALRDPDTLATYRAPVLLARFGQRFETRNDLLASFTFGVGAAKAPAWRSWFQVSLGARATFGPAFLGGELSFESDDVLRLSLGLGVSVF